MSPRNFLILLVITVAAVAAAAVAVVIRPGDAVYANLGDPVVPGLIDNLNDLQSIRIESQSGGVLTFQRTDQDAADATGAKWGIVERDLYPVKTKQVNSLAVRVAELTYLAPKTATPELFSHLELQDPSAPGSKAIGLKMTGNDGSVMADMIIGKARSTLEGSAQGGTYFRKPGGERAWFAKGSVEIGKLISEWIETDIFDIKTKRIRRAEITYPDGDSLAIFKDKEEDLDFTLIGVPAGKKVKSRFAVNGFAATIDEYRIQDVARRDKHPIDPAKVTKVIYETFDGLKVTALIQLPEEDDPSATPAARPSDNPEYWVALTVEGGEGTAEADDLRARTAPWVFRISDYRYDAIAKRKSDMVEDAGGS